MPNTPVILRARSLVAPLALLVDGYPDRRHKLTSRTGSEPLEDGREATDHNVANPAVLQLTGSVSDLGGDQRPTAAWRAIVKIWKASEPVRVITEWETYPEMIIGRCEGIPIGRGLRFEMEMREIIRVHTGFAFEVPSTAQAGVANNRSAESTRGRVSLQRVLGFGEFERRTRERVSLQRVLGSGEFERDRMTGP